MNISTIELLEPRIAPATLTVTNLSDSGSGSLRSTIAASHDGDSIVFKAGLTGLIHVKSQMLVKDSITINGAGKITLDGDNATRIFDIDDGSSLVKKVTIAGLNLRDGAAKTEVQATIGPFGTKVNLGYSGGAIVANEAVTITNCNFTGNNADFYGGAVYAPVYGRLTVLNSSFSSNRAELGGAVAASGFATISIQGASFTGNYASYGGGAVFATGGDADNPFYSGPAVNSITIANSQFDKNTSALAGGAAYLQAGDTTTITLTGDHFSRNQSSESSALALFMDASSTAKITSTTIESNLASTHATVSIVGQGAVSFVNSTLKNNQAVDGGGISYQGGYAGQSPAGTLLLKGTTISGNQATFGGGIYLQGGALTLDHSSIRDNVASVGGGIFKDNSVLVSTVSAIASIIKDNTPDQIALGS